MNFLKIAFRNILKHKVFSIINVVGLAVGMACVILILSWVNDEFKYDEFHENSDEIYRVVFDFESGPTAGTCGALAPALNEEIPEIKSYVRFWTRWNTGLNNKEVNVKAQGTFVDPTIFEVFKFQFLQGNPATALLESHSLVITESIADKLFSNREKALGENIEIPNRSGTMELFTITGIIKDIPEHSHLQFNFLFSIELLKEWYRPDYIDSWRSNYTFSAYVIAPGINDVANLNQKITDCYNKHSNYNEKLYLQPLKDVYLSSEVKSYLGSPSGNRNYVRIFTLLAIFILIIACINFINISTARASKRSKEIGLQKVIGAKKEQLITQFFGESFLLSFLSMPLALLIVMLIGKSFDSLTGKSLSLNFHNPIFILMLIGFICLTSLIAGTYPALYLSSFKPSSILSNQLHKGKGKLSRNVLVIFQFSVSILVIVATLSIFTQMKYIQNKYLGFDKENLINCWGSGYDNKIIKEELLKNPNIVSVTGTGSLINQVGWGMGIPNWQGRENDSKFSVMIMEVDYDFIKTYDIKLDKGRYYSEDIRTDVQESIVVNTKAVEAMGMKEPIGKTMYFNGKDRTIIGVVNDFHIRSLHEPIQPVVLFLYPKKLSCLGIRIKQNNLAVTIAYIEEVMNKINPDEGFSYSFLDEQMNDMYQSEERRAKLFGSFAVVSILLSCLGLFGLISFLIEQSIKEIGLRKVNGAKIHEVVTMLYIDLIKWIIISFVIATPFAWYAMNKWLENFTYKTDLSWWIFLLSGGITLGIALLTVSWQSWRAATRNPVEALRYE